MNFVFPASKKPVNEYTGIGINASLYAEASCNCSFVDFRADDTKSACYGGAAAADVDLARNMVKMDPRAVNRCDDALCAQNHAVDFGVIQVGQDCFDFLGGEFLCSFFPPACENLVGMMMVMVLMFLVAVMAIAILIMVVMVLVMVFMLVVLMFLVAVVAVAILIMVMMVLVMVFMLVVLMFFMAMRTVAVLMVVLVFMVMMRKQLRQLLRQAVLILHCI